MLERQSDWSLKLCKTEVCVNLFSVPLSIERKKGHEVSYHILILRHTYSPVGSISVHTFLPTHSSLYTTLHYVFNSVKKIEGHSIGVMCEKFWSAIVREC